METGKGYGRPPQVAKGDRFPPGASEKGCGFVNALTTQRALHWVRPTRTVLDVCYSRESAPGRVKAVERKRIQLQENEVRPVVYKLSLDSDSKRLE